MTAPWLTVVGMGEDGPEGLTPAARLIIESAELLVGSERLLALVPERQPERLAWPSPFEAMPARLEAWRGRRVVVLATGDPLNYGVGRKLLQHLGIDEIRFLPHLSAFSLAAARLGWSLPDVETLSLHGRSAAGIEAAIAPGVCILALTAGEDTVREVARRLVARGYGASALTVLEHMGGTGERRIGHAHHLRHRHAVPQFHRSQGDRHRCREQDSSNPHCYYLPVDGG